MGLFFLRGTHKQKEKPKNVASLLIHDFQSALHTRGVHQLLRLESGASQVQSHTRREWKGGEGEEYKAGDFSSQEGSQSRQK